MQISLLSYLFRLMFTEPQSSNESIIYLQNLDLCIHLESTYLVISSLLFLEMRHHFSTALKKFRNYRFLLMFMRSLLMKFNENYIVIRSNLSKTDFTRQISTFMKIVNFKNKLQIVNSKHCVYSWKLRNEKTESNKLRRFTSKVS